MRATVHDRLLKVRVNEGLRLEAEALARHSGMSLSELMRSALRRELRELRDAA